MTSQGGREKPVAERGQSGVLWKRLNKEAFAQAVEEVKTLKEEPNQDEQAALQGLFKQATVGDINIERPGMMDVVGKANWDAWNSRKGLTKEEAMGLFCQLVENLKGKYGVET